MTPKEINEMAAIVEQFAEQRGLAKQAEIALSTLRHKLVKAFISPAEAAILEDAVVILGDICRNSRHPEAVEYYEYSKKHTSKPIKKPTK